MIPSLTAAETIEMNPAKIKDYHIELIQMMENAGRNFAELARRQWMNCSRFWSCYKVKPEAQLIGKFILDRLFKNR